MAARRKVVGIVRETYSVWERRVPLCPAHVAGLTKQGIDVRIQPSTRRIFRDSEYAAAGATVSMDLSPADVIVGVKQVKEEEILPDKTYIFFSHVIKGQLENMSLLDTIIDRNVTLVDYECLTAGGVAGGPRLIAFGEYAGRAGMINSLRGLGDRLLRNGFATPFINIGSAYMYPSLDQARDAVAAAGQAYAEGGAPAVGGGGQSQFPLTFVFTGNGAVSSGAQEMFSLLPHEMVSPSDLAAVATDGDPSKLYGTVAEPGDFSERIEPGDFSMREYLESPHMYRPVFHERFLPHTSVLMNCMYWDSGFPRLISSEQLREAHLADKNRLLVVGDVTCDVGGSIEMLARSTNIEDPFLIWDPAASEVTTSDSEGVLVLGVDILPSELPRESSQHFGDLLEPMISKIALDEVDPELQAVLQGGTIAADRALRPQYEYIHRLAEKQRDQAAKAVADSNSESTCVVIRGHLFDTGLINKTLDLLEALRVPFRVMDLDVQPNVGFGTQTPSRVVIELPAEKERAMEVCSAVQLQLAAFPQAHATMTVA